jgi:hypothetical protein
MAANARKQICSTRRKRVVQDRRKKVVERRHVFYKFCIDE